MALKLGNNYQEISQEPEPKNDVYNSDFREVLNLKNCLDSTLPQKQLYIIIKVATIFHLVKKYTTFFTDAPRSEENFKEILLKVVFISNVNAKAIFERYNGNLKGTATITGYGLYPLASLLGYACFFNVAMIAHGNSMVINIVLPIKKGERLVSDFIINNYLDGAEDYQSGGWKSVRTKIFRELNIVCSCEYYSGVSAIHLGAATNSKHEVQMFLEKMLTGVMNDREKIKKMIPVFAERLQVNRNDHFIYFKTAFNIHTAYSALGNSLDIAPKIAGSTRI